MIDIFTKKIKLGNKVYYYYITSSDISMSTLLLPPCQHDDCYAVTAVDVTAATVAHCCHNGNSDSGSSDSVATATKTCKT